MALKPVTLENLKELDMGKAAEAWNLHAQRASRDCLDRPADPKPRKIVLELELVPVLESDGTCEEVAARLHVSSTVPKHRTKPYSFGLKHNGALIFNPDSPTCVNQATFLDDDDEPSDD